MKGAPTEKTKWRAKVEVHRVHGELVGLALRLKENDLDEKPALDAAKTLWKVASEVDKKAEGERAAKQKYRDSFNRTHVAADEERDELRRENEELKRRLALQPTR